MFKDSQMIAKMRYKGRLCLKYHRPFWKLYLKYLCAACVISFTSMFCVTLSEDLVDWFASFHTKIDVNRIAHEFQNDKTIYENTTAADEMSKKVRILCLVITTSGHLNKQIPVVNATWGTRCNKILYVMCTDKKQPDILNSCDVTESKSHLTRKVRFMLRYVYLHYLKDYDWILKADDDTYVIMENLRFLLSFHNPDLPGYLGYHFNMHLKQGYMSGGAGYVISRSGLKKVIEVAFKENGCPPDGKDEDLDIGKCLQMAGVPPLVSYDKYGRETFHTDKVWQHLYGTVPRYLKKYSWNGISDGGGCCSQFSVTFHHVNPQTMLLMHQMLYRTSVYGRQTPTDISDMFHMAKVLPLL
ncbi:glycoprotein-N-acetylgalactosamine 3-beta-galactosyltransferase [Mytilus galloprovincialis]|uniref:N-acetylgalactosaminide beta-1,3-galactosyltransferase n=1 Tax=Mytilus galloprovincialis TaxID=29158 RepID=A0A8B6FJW5_MYTGA|nr:glycoprotein-N-acetylgalactosamine 3-beta-galactosyltransferase [Mytilus galloprovincialis]